VSEKAAKHLIKGPKTEGDDDDALVGQSL